MRVETLPVGPLQANCHLIVDDAAGAVAIVDPGGEGERVVAAVRATGAAPTAVWLTHAHFDHVGGVAAVVEAFDVPVWLHPADAPLYAVAERQAASYGLALEPPPPVSDAFAEGAPVRVGTLEFAVFHAPGHAPGHVVLHGHGIALVGDCLFAGSVGRTDLPLSDPAALVRSLERIAALPPETRVLAGHGPATTIAAERATNPFLTGAARLVLR